MNIVPIFLPTDLHEAFITYCMAVLRPGLHNVLETGGQRIFAGSASLEYLRVGWEHYLAANEAIARVVFALYKDGDVAWINDFYLCMMPRFLVKWCVAAFGRRPPQLFFLHSPFPTSEIFRTLPVRDELLGKGM
jgi:trehalose-6-phosphate synthase